MIEPNPQKYIKQGNNYYSKVKKKLINYQDDLQFMHTQLNRKFRFAPCGGCASGCRRSSRDFQRAFMTLSEMQKSQYYYSFTRLTYNTLFNIPQQAIVFPQKKQIMQVYFLSSLTWKWQLKDIQVNYMERKITLINQEISINLRNFIMRLSKNKERKGVVLESLCSIEYIETIRMSNQNEAFQDLVKKFKVLMASALRERISRKLGMNLIINEQKSIDGKKSVSIENQLQQRVLSLPQRLKVKATNSFKPEEEIIPTQKLIPVVFQRKGSTFENIKPKIESFSHFQQFQQIRQNVFYNEQEGIMRKQYEFQYQNQSFIVLPWICDNLTNHKYFKHWKKSLLKSQLLQQKSNCKLLRETYQKRQKLSLDFYYIKANYAQKSIIYLFDSPSFKEKMQSDAQLDYCLTKMQKTSNYLKLLMQCRIKFKKQVSRQAKRQIHDDFLGNAAFIVNGVIHKKEEINSIAFEDDYLSKINNTEKNPEDSFFSIDSNTNQSVTFQECTQRPMHVWDQHNEIPSNNFLNVTHYLQPLPKLGQRLRHPRSAGEHPCWQNQWMINEKGEMISINLQKVKAQNSVLKEVLKNLGKNFLSGRSILNVSLPVTIFSTQTNLSNICNSYSYAPRLLQQAARQTNPVDKLKYVVAFNISCAIIEIQMQKPFNPILGETYQATIDGCPVFGEQISHHPPISATYMKGRGYRLFGQFQSKVSMGINSAVGTSDGIMNIVFEDGSSEIRYTSFSGEMTGLVIGDRKLSLVGSNHFIDTKKNIYLQMRFGKHKGITEYSKYADGVQGKIVRVKQGVDLSKFWEIKQEHIVEQYGYIHGRWTSDIFYDEECIFNSWNQLPYIVTPYLHSLDSDSLKRLDLKERVNLNYDKAQQYKEDLEIIQRNDRKLRLAYKK